MSTLYVIFVLLFLAAFTVYSIVKGLENIFKRNLMGYVSLLFLAGSALIYFILAKFFAQNDSCGGFLLWPLIIGVFGIGVFLLLMSGIGMLVKRFAHN